jgi:hypothetical protein
MLRSLPWLLVALIITSLLPPPTATNASAAPPDLSAEAADRGEFFGMVGRDPRYTLDVDGHVIAPEAPADFLDRMAADIAGLGARWIRIEFHAETNGGDGAGFIDYDKYDYFIRVIAPRHGLKVLALLNSGIVAEGDPYYSLLRLDDPADGAGAEPDDRSNNYIRVFSDRAREIAAHYRDAIAAYEIFNEPNVNVHKLQVTNGAAQEIDPERFGTLAISTAMAIKRVQPRARVVLGGLLHGAPVEKPGRIPSDYLAEVYQAPRVQWFYTTRPLGAEILFPWEAVALHPYDLSVEDVETHVREVKARLVSVGDDTSRIWITEIGMQAEPPPIRSHWLMAPTLQEQQQAAYLTAVYSRLLALPDMVERVFWFKYEDFREQGLPRNWGLVRLRETGGGQYDPALVPYPRKAAYAAYQRLARPSALPIAPRDRAAPAPEGRAFSQTGHAISGAFLRYWEVNGGLAQFGLPRTAPFRQGGRLVQYFERARFEWYPEYAGTPNEVQLGLLGQHLVGERPARSGVPPRSGPNTRYFPETRHNLSNGFKAYWEQNGGLRLFGLPLTEEYRERNPADGREYTVQYFERARFEYHPEFRGTPYEVQLGLLGNQILAEQFWYR